MIKYIVENYPGEGETVEPNEKLFATLAEARAEVSLRLGDIADWRKWSDTSTDDSIVDPKFVPLEAYHESDSVCCGGVGISQSI